MKSILIIFFSIVTFSVAQIYQESNGVVIIEAENTLSPLDLWLKKTSIAGFTGPGYIDFTGNSFLNGPPKSPLEYSFKINQGGLYYLHLHCARETQIINGETRHDVSNDGFVRVEGNYGAGPNPGNNHGNDAPLTMLKSNTKFFGGNHNSFVWASGNRLDPGGHNNKRVAIYDFIAGETYKLVVSGRSKAFKLNRIMFRRFNVRANTAQNLNNPESTISSPSIVYRALTDFSMLNSGEVPYYKDTARDALAINAGVVADRNKFAKAKVAFNGSTGSYDVTITTLTEEDGESVYRLLVDGKVVGTYTNSYIGPGSPLDMQPETHTWPGILVSEGSIIEVESNTHTNGEIPETGGTAWSRGRWRQLEFTQASNQDYTTWITLYPGTAAENLAPNKDADGDGATNLFEYMFGLNPLSADSSSPVTTGLSPVDGTFKYTRRNPNLTGYTSYQVWSSENLINWVHDTAARQVFDSAADLQEVTVTLSNHSSIAPKKFVQIRVVK